MTRDKIKNTPEIVDYLLDKSVIADSRKKLHKRLDEICNLAIKALEQEKDILKNLSKRVENIEKQMKEDREGQLKKLKAELDYVKFRCALPTM